MLGLPSPCPFDCIVDYFFDTAKPIDPQDGAIYSLSVSSEDNGDVDVAPDRTWYDPDTLVHLSANPDPFWEFTGWTGSVVSSDNPLMVVMDAHVVIQANFAPVPPIISNIQMVPQGTTAVVTWETEEAATTELDFGICPDFGSGSFVDPSLVTQHAVTLTGLEEFTLYHLRITAASPNSLTEIEEGLTLITSKDLLLEDFNTYTVGQDPVDWFDTEADNSLSEDDSLFKVMQVGSDIVMGSSAFATNIHSHYLGSGSDGWSNYEIAGRMRYSTADSGIGVTFYSDYPNADIYYRLRSNNGANFEIQGHNAEPTGGIMISNVAPLPNSWYRFRITVEDTGTQTEIRAKIWPESAGEPVSWQIDCVADGSGPDPRLTSGTVGLWCGGFPLQSGDKLWDDLSVTALDFPPLSSSIIAQTSFEASQGFTGFPAGNDSDLLGTIVDPNGVIWSSTDGAHILNRADVPPDGTQVLALGLTDPNESVHIQIPGSEHGVSLVQFDYASFSKQTDAVISVCSKGSSDSEWVEAFSQPVSGADPNWTIKPWPTLTALVIVLGEVDIRIKTGCRQVLIDNVLIRDLICPNVAPVFNQDPVVKPAAIEDRSYAASLSADIFDPNEGDTLTFSLLSASP